MKYWKTPPVIKAYEALGAIADGRVQAIDRQSARVSSSDGTKEYGVSYDSGKNAIMANDNGSYWVGYLGYPSIAFLMTLGVLPYDEEVAQSLKGIAWKEINQKHKNDFDKTMEEIFSGMSLESRGRLEELGGRVLKKIEILKIGKLGKRKRPPREVLNR